MVLNPLLRFSQVSPAGEIGPWVVPGKFSCGYTCCLVAGTVPCSENQYLVIFQLSRVLTRIQYRFWIQYEKIVVFSSWMASFEARE